jgi:predicted HAD superfamily phosphohydrolase YqeG
MTYLINKNTTRYFDDSLLMAFRDFFYDPSPEVTIDRMKRMELGYLLVDLNAATIDKDPRHNLTDRFEKLLLTMKAKNLRLVATDNFCIELAINERKK